MSVVAMYAQYLKFSWKTTGQSVSSSIFKSQLYVGAHPVEQLFLEPRPDYNTKRLGHKAGGAAGRMRPAF